MGVGSGTPGRTGLDVRGHRRPRRDRTRDGMTARALSCCWRKQRTADHLLRAHGGLWSTVASTLLVSHASPGTCGWCMSWSVHLLVLLSSLPLYSLLLQLFFLPNNQESSYLHLGRGPGRGAACPADRRPCTPTLSPADLLLSPLSCPSPRLRALTLSQSCPRDPALQLIWPF